MPLALLNTIDIELLIEGSRDELFKRITSQDPCIPFGHVPHELASTLQASSGRRTLAAHDKPLTFFIQDSYLSTDESERIFKVQCGTLKCYYYAFEFNDCIACPAFLVTRFKLTNYACLDVSNGLHYYYIFLSRKDEPLPKILDKQSKFRGKFNLKIPSIST